MFDTYSEIFAERACSYHSAMEEVPNARNAEFQAVIEPIAASGDRIVCDMPAGGGYLASYLPRQMRYIGVEPVAEFIRASRGREVSIIEASLTDIPLPSGSVDSVVSLAGLHHEANLTSVFREMRRITRHGGHISLADVAVNTGAARFLNGFVDEHNPMGHKGKFLDENTCSLLESEGLSVASDQLIDVPWTFTSFEEAGAFCGKLFGVIGLHPHEVAEALAADVGFNILNSKTQLMWSLRRIVCLAA